MKLKTVCLAGLTSLAVTFAASAADVFSVNAVGFVNITVPAGGFKIVGNPLNQAANTLVGILPNAPVGTKVFKYNAGSSTFAVFTMRSGTPNFWSGAGASTATFNPGEGFFVQNTTVGDITLTFVGEVAQGSALTIDVPVGFSMLAAHVPQSASLQSVLGLPAQNNDKVYFYRNGNYVIATRRSTFWSGAGALNGSGEPQPEVGEGFFFLNAQASPATWVRSFSANTP